MKQFVLVPTSKVVVDVQNIAYIIRAELNKFVLVPKRTVSPNAPVLDGNEFDALVKFLEQDGQLAVLEVVAPEEKPNLIAAK